MEAKRLLLMLLVATPAFLVSVDSSSLEEQGCHEQCTNGCFGPGAEECCHEQCAPDDGCTDSTDMGCTDCLNVRLDGRCRTDCGPAFIYNEVTFELEPNPDFKFQHGYQCVEKCPKFAFTEHFSCLEVCGKGYRAEGDQCVRCGGACPVRGEVNPLVNDQCDGVKQHQWGVINRKNSPTGNVTCTQVLIGQPGSKLKAKLMDVSIQSGIDEKLVLVADGYRQSFDRETYATTLYLDSNVLIVQHRTVATGNGYMLAYNFMAPEGEVAEGCDQVFTTNSGSFQSPGYPNKYRNRERCTYQIIVDPGYRVEVVFNRLYLQGEEPSCLSDQLEVREPILGTSTTYCGRHKPPFTINSRTNYLVLRFVSDDSNNYKGFTAKFNAVEVPEGEKEDFTVDSGLDLPLAF
ncbi:cubilin-like [Acanthaster planci]|uniref:Cubilin-like n=1 Tax=Acanthaster planci TaxID=133434 RepID=A0A8B7Z8U6_ACAPL|nr:cubilin-like [Acanthaster planci]